MMKRSILAASAALLFGAQSASAQSASDAAFVYLIAHVPQTCSVDANGFVGPDGTNTIDYSSQIVNGSLAPIASSLAPVASILATCNSADTTLSLESANQGLLNSNPPAAVAGNFAPATLPYDVTGNWSGISAALFESDAYAPGLPVEVLRGAGAVSGNINLTIALDSQADPLLAGYYEDTLTVTVATGV